MTHTLPASRRYEPLRPAAYLTRHLTLPRLFWTLFLLDAGLALLGIWFSYPHRQGAGRRAVDGLQLALAMVGGLATTPLGLLFLIVRSRPVRTVLLGLLVAINLVLLAVI